ncbi:hypothetical protein BDB01DRAFT_777285 [Pilobolus umbonatus]|nr:hypothetical protein BDB01DRAFT_777285 [Pilobolus umbonatus]
MSNEEKNENRIPRWKYRKQRKIEKRRQKRKKIAESRPEVAPMESEDPHYEASKLLWEKREETHKLIELARLKTQEKEKRAKEAAEKKWRDTLLNIPLISPTISQEKKIVKTFVQPTLKKTYRERFYEQKMSKDSKQL